MSILCLLSPTEGDNFLLAFLLVLPFADFLPALLLFAIVLLLAGLVRGSAYLRLTLEKRQPLNGKPRTLHGDAQIAAHSTPI